MNPLRIVQYIGDFGLGGSQKAPCVFGLQLAALGHATAVVAGEGGPRHLDQPPANLTHTIVGTKDPSRVAQAINAFNPDIVHIHGPDFMLDYVHALGQREGRIIVCTPVFGRRPSPKRFYKKVRTCLVGCYTFYRFCRWMGLSSRRAIENGVAYIPITPYQPPATLMTTLDAPADIARRRADFGLPADAFVLGRIGRDDPAKWSGDNESLVNALLQRIPNAHWLSIGYPTSMGRERLAAQWGPRFINLPETPDYQLIARALSCFDLQAFFSRGECFASSISEAAGAAVPTIALSTPLNDNGQAEQVIDNLTGQLVGNVEQAVAFAAQLAADPARLTRLKQSTRDHAHSRWHLARATDDLVSLYRHWLHPNDPPPAYLQTMREEHDAFAQDYRTRMISLGTKRLKLQAVECWPTFLLGRKLKSLLT